MKHQKDIMKIDKALVYNICLEEAMKLDFVGKDQNSYNVIFLASMVLGKVRHPEQNMIELAKKAMKMMPGRYKKKEHILEVSAARSLDQLESALETAQNLPEEWIEGWTVGSVVKKLANIVGERLNEEILE